MSITLTKITTEIDHKRKLTTTAIFIIFRTTTKLTRKSFGTVIIENWNSENLKKLKCHSQMFLAVTSRCIKPSPHLRTY